ncbi:Ig-like domain-containing protein, partial [Oryzihumus sp.]
MGCKSALQRYGALGLSALIVTSGSAFIAAAPASADPANPVTGIMITDPTGLVASVKHDGTNSTVHIGAAVTGKDDLAGVKFYYQSAGGQLTLINYDTTFPYSADWSAGAGTYTLKADAVTAGGTTLAEDTNPGVVVSDSTSSVHLTTGDGASIGEFHKQIVVRGTR